MAGSFSYVKPMLSCITIAVVVTAASVNAETKELASSKVQPRHREPTILSSDIVSLDISAINSLLETEKKEKEEKEKELAKQKEEELKQQVCSGSSYVTPNTYTGRFRLSTHNDSDDVIIQNINRDTHNSRIAGMGEFILLVGKQWNIDPYVLVAIAKQESTYGKATPAGCPNNLFGRKAVGGGWQDFGSLQEAFSNEAAYLASQYLDIGLTNLDSIGEKYCPGQGWPDAIRARLREIRS